MLKPSFLKPRKFAALEQALGYKFRAIPLLERALTHASVRGRDAKRQDNERLEFIGDRVLGLAVVELLHETDASASEGEMARRFNRLVRGETCARVARSIALGNHLLLAESEVENGGRDKDNILADAMEAVIGAVFLDGGFDKARLLVRRLWQASEGMPATAATGADPKTALQEWAQARGLALPKYVNLARTGPDHAPVFTAEVRLDGFNAERGEGPSKRSAEQAAARAMLARVSSP